MHDGSLGASGHRSASAASRDAIIAAATEIPNRRGVRGMTLALVAERVGLITTSVTYYFKKKDELAAACFLSGVERLKALVREASAEPTASARVRRPRWNCTSPFAPASPPARRRRFRCSAISARSRRQRSARPPPPTRSCSAASGAFSRRRTRKSSGAARRPPAPRSCSSRSTGWRPGCPATRPTTTTASVTACTTSWSAAVSRPRPAPFSSGDSAAGSWVVAAPGGRTPQPADAASSLAATRLINQRGYHGPPPWKLISASLNVTKGSFYHHLQRQGRRGDRLAFRARLFEQVRGAQLAGAAPCRATWSGRG